MKYVIIVIVLLSLFFGIQLYFNSNKNVNLEENINTNQNMNKLEIRDTVIGNGSEAVKGSIVTVHYTGRFEDGKVFDSSVDRGPFTFNLGSGEVIKGWDEGFAGMKVGGKRVISVPPELGYGMNDYGPIPGGSVLIFDVELLKVE
jgi:FKBP-type peptidyl-prolyl cis-trans isomerase